MSSTISTEFTRRMRKETAAIHSVSDALVNVKLGLTISDDSVWYEGLLLFSEVFGALEEAMTRCGDSLIGDLDLPGLRRTEGFRQDLRSYYGADLLESRRQEALAREPLKDYLSRLDLLERDDPHLLTAYIYHLYMGLLSGGQVLKLKRRTFPVVTLKSGGNADGEEDGMAVFRLDPPAPVMKKMLRESMNRMAEHLDPETRDRIIREGVEVFRLNNDLVRTVRGVDDVLRRRALYFGAVVAVAVAAVAIVLMLIVA